jgi:iron(III) transport system substrate-binding protein
MKLKSIILGLAFVCVSFESLAFTNVTIYGNSKSFNQTGKVGIYDKLATRFNKTVGREKHIKLTYLTKRQELGRTFHYGVSLPDEVDIIQISDSLQLGQVARWDILKSVDSPILKSNIPAHLRDDEDKWFGITKRYRILYTNVNNANEGDVSSLSDLGSPLLQNHLCLRNAEKSYSISFMSFLIDQLGMDNTEMMVKSWMQNGAKIKNKDMTDKEGKTGVLQAVQNGECYAGVANTYYLGQLKDQGKADHIRPIFPAQSTNGVHVNLKSYAILESSNNQKAAQVVLEWLSGTAAQKMLTWSTHEHPVNDKTPLSAFHKYLESFGPIVENVDYDLERTYKLKSHALRLMNKLGWK